MILKGAVVRAEEKVRVKDAKDEAIIILVPVSFKSSVKLLN